VTRAADVAVVGFGPVGATLTGLLARRGLSVAVFDREEGIYALPRAAHIDHTGLRTIQELGCLDVLLPTMLPNPGTDLVTAKRTLLARIPSDQATLSGLPASVYFYQPTFDRTLRQAVGARPEVSVHLATEVVALEQGPDGVLVRTRSLGGSAAGPDGAFEVGWVVGCDGASSFVRESQGITRESLHFEEQWLIYDLELLRGDLGLPDCAVQVCDPRRPHTEFPIPGNRFRFEFMAMPGDDPARMLTTETFASLVGGVMDPAGARVERTATYTFQGLVADTWRLGRVFIAGDAAHLMPPFLGQGMCSGIRDAANLAWKLARVVQGSAPEALLDTYGPERRPHVKRVIESAVALGRIICTTDPDEAAERDRRLLGDDAALEARFRFVLPHLEPGPLVLGGGGRLAPQSAGADGTALDDVVGNRFLVLAVDRSALGPEAQWWEDNVGAWVVTPEDLPDADGRLGAWLARRGASVAVIRPDRYVLGTADDLVAITEAVRPWLCAPAASASEAR
jgi:3-(3-hydroxy-phenyl)propionate hydroxylase